MTKNTHYIFLEALKNHPHYSPKKGEISSKLSRENKRYMLYQLPIAPLTVKDNSVTYRLNNHHISFYEEVDAQHPCLSAYHYTAEFIDDQKQRHALHVYFNTNDHLTLQAQFTDKRGSEALITLFEKQAIECTRPHIMDLKCLRKKFLSELHQDYLLKQKNLGELFTQIEHSNAPYLSTLDELIEITKKLAKFEPNKHYKGLSHLLSKTKLLITSPTLIKTSTESKPLVETSTVISFFKKPLSPKIQLKLKMYIDAANTTLNTYLALKNHQNFDPFQRAFNQLNLLSLDGNTCLTPQDLHLIQRLEAVMNEEGFALLKHCLKQHDVENLDPLAVFLDDFPKDEINEAIASGNANTLSFLLDHCSIDLNDYLIEGIPLVTYCMDILAINHADQAIKCLNVLVRHNASLMIDSTSGLPVAYELLSNNQHPLRSLLISCSNETVSNPIFYQTLSRKLLPALMNKAPECTARNIKIQSDIQYYKKLVDVHSMPCSPIKKASLLNLEKTLQLKQTEIPQSLSDFIRSDRDINQAYDHMRLAEDRFRDAIKKDRHASRQFEKEITIAIQKMEQRIRTLEVDFTRLSGKDVKIALISIYGTNRAIYEKSLRLYELNKISMTLTTHNGRISSQQAASQAQAMQLQQEIQTLVESEGIGAISATYQPPASFNLKAVSRATDLCEQLSEQLNIHWLMLSQLSTGVTKAIDQFQSLQNKLRTLVGNDSDIFGDLPLESTSAKNNDDESISSARPTST